MKKSVKRLTKSELKRLTDELPDEFHSDMTVGSELVISGKPVRINKIELIVHTSTLYSLYSWQDKREKLTVVIPMIDFKNPLCELNSAYIETPNQGD